MDHISNDELRNLLTEREGYACSIYMPTQYKGQETQQNPIRFKNHLNKLEGQLIERGLDKDKARRLLEPGYRLVNDFDFWHHQGKGLAVFLSEDGIRTYRLPAAFQEMAVANNRFHVKPLLPLLSEDGRFHILAISQNEVRLLEASRFNVRRIESKNIPESLRDALWFLQEEKSLRAYSGTSTPGLTRASHRKGGGMMFAGAGGGQDAEEEKLRIAEFLNIVDRGVRQLIDDGTHAPLVIAGVEYLHPIYKEQSEYPNVITGQITGNQEMIPDEELHARAWKVVEPLFKQGLKRVKDSYLVHAGRKDGLATNKLREIVPAAYFQRVESLIIAADAEQWGKFNPDTGKVTLHKQRKSDAEDMVDFAARHALLNGAEVYAVDRQQVPNGEIAVATFRF